MGNRSYRESGAALAQYRGQIAELRKKMREVQAGIEPEEVTDYVLCHSRWNVAFVGAVRDEERALGASTIWGVVP